MLRRLVKLIAPGSLSSKNFPRFSSSGTVLAKDLEVHADSLDAKEAADIYRKYGCLVVRGLNVKYVDDIRRTVELQAEQSIQLLPEKKKIPEGWLTSDGTLFIPAPEGSSRKEQIMVLGVDYFTCAALLAASIDEKCLDIVEQIIGPNVELFGKGQILYKEPSGGHAKFMHQDSAYFEFAKDGPVGTLNYCIDTNLSLNNGPLFVVPGSHRQGYIDHIDTHSHLALDPEIWPFNRGVPIEGKAGDTIFFHVHTVHGSQHNCSASPRPVFINRYLRPDDYQTIQATSVKMRSEAKEKLAERAGKPPLKERTAKDCVGNIT
ncbi:uncharacterized protein LOC134184400 isoform X2 [Corticium candelabrum]|uniref:uncharacterized protein LOC134184400 isoform X2 n=1 Tax=Corticium candelabrum TaxID=121492 RepID=UPI002E2F90E4|nr:uncharacterized protein LOC134184400 isoform X2 [Corticium candelabrum]